MKDAAELSRGLLRKARSDRIAMEASLGAEVFDAGLLPCPANYGKVPKSLLG